MTSMLSGSILKRDINARETDKAKGDKGQSLKDVIDATNRDIEAIFASQKSKIPAKAA